MLTGLNLRTCVDVEVGCAALDGSGLVCLDGLHGVVDEGNHTFLCGLGNECAYQTVV